MIEQSKPKSKPRCCPVCGHSFIPWSIWKISRWTYINCPNCDARLIRRIDLQLVLICFIYLIPASIIFLPIPIAWRAAVVLFGFILSSILDALTVRLVKAGKYRGLLGYDIENC